MIHAWTPREHVRKFTDELSNKFSIPYVVHLEDNEEQIINDELSNENFEYLKKLPKQYQDVIIHPHRTHPSNNQILLKNSLGITYLIKDLLKFVPAGKSSLLFFPGFDKEFEILPSNVSDIRNNYKISSDEIIILYSGNVHASTVDDITKLYIAVQVIRDKGLRVRLIRTGWNYSNVLAPKDLLDPSAFLELGFVPRCEIPRLLAISDILVQPGKSDLFNDYRFPSKFPEYLVSGKPVILPDSNVGKLLTDNVHALKLYTGSLKELIEKLELLVSNVSLRVKLKRESKKFALEYLK